MRKTRLVWAATTAIGACVLLLTLVSNVSADPPDKVTLAASPASITANGLTTTTITATVTDRGTLLDGVTVTFTTTLGVFANWEQMITVTTTQGVAVTWLRSVPASGTITSTLGADAAGTAFTGTQILFTANPCNSDLTAWTEYAANPIFGQGVDGNTLRAYYPSVLYDPDQFGGLGDARHYKMWYGTRVGSDYGTGYAVSDDGIHWVTVTVPVTNILGYHAHVVYDSDRFGGDVDEPYYKMWYWDVSNSINYATSDDGVDWTDYVGNPVITNALGWGSAPVYDAFVIYNSSGEPAHYEAWIDNNGRFYYITSTNGITWTGNNRELLADREDWELSTYSRASVLKADGAYHMWYGGSSSGGGNHGIGYAVSTDGQHWLKSADNPIFHKDDGPVWRDGRSYTPRVLYSATRFDGHGSPEQYKMWFTGRDTLEGNYVVGYATLNPVSLFLGGTSGSGQSGVVGGALGQPFVVGLRDGCGNPAGGVSITFVISGSSTGAVGQSLSVLAGATDVSGQVSTTLTLGDNPGPYTVTAQAAGVSGMPAVFTATATSGPVHHFTFATVGEQVERRAFTITIMAEDAFSNTVTAYTAPVALTDTTGTITPTLSSSFVGGVLTQAVTINAEGTDVVITAAHTTTSTIAGFSNSFDVIPVRVVNLNTGEWFVTIQDAIDDADTLSGAGHVISATAGIYNENVNITKSDITLTGVGAGVDPAHHTIIDGLTPADVGSSPGINLPSGITGVTIRDLRVQSFHNSSGINAAGRNDNFVVSNTHVYSNAINLGFANGGIYMNGPVTNVLVTNSELQYNRGRGFVIWNGFKQHITVTNNIVRHNNCCGIELQDGTASGVLIAGNIVEENADNGIGLVGLTSGGGANRVFSNTLKDNGRFGIEIKLPDGTGLDSGDGSIVVEENRVERTFVPVDARDLAGIAAFRRSWVPGNGNVDIPTGVVIRSNVVRGYVQPTASDGFGIVVEGTNMTVLSNTVANNDVGIQVQAGHQPYVPNTGTDGDQSNLLLVSRKGAPLPCTRSAWTANRQIV